MSVSWCEACKINYTSEHDKRLHEATIKHQMNIKTDGQEYFCNLCTYSCQTMAEYSKHVQSDSHKMRIQWCEQMNNDGRKELEMRSEAGGSRQMDPPPANQSSNLFYPAPVERQTRWNEFVHCQRFMRPPSPQPPPRFGPPRPLFPRLDYQPYDFGRNPRQMYNFHLPPPRLVIPGRSRGLSTFGGPSTSSFYQDPFHWGRGFENNYGSNAVGIPENNGGTTIQERTKENFIQKKVKTPKKKFINDKVKNKGTATYGDSSDNIRTVEGETAQESVDLERENMNVHKVVIDDEEQCTEKSVRTSTKIIGKPTIDSKCKQQMVQLSKTIAKKRLMEASGQKSKEQQDLLAKKMLENPPNLEEDLPIPSTSKEAYGKKLQKTTRPKIVIANPRNRFPGDRLRLLDKMGTKVINSANLRKQKEKQRQDILADRPEITYDSNQDKEYVTIEAALCNLFSQGKSTAPGNLDSIESQPGLQSNSSILLSQPGSTTEQIVVNNPSTSPSVEENESVQHVQGVKSLDNESLVASGADTANDIRPSDIDQAPPINKVTTSAIETNYLNSAEGFLVSTPKKVSASENENALPVENEQMTLTERNRELTLLYGGLMFKLREKAIHFEKLRKEICEMQEEQKRIEAEMQINTEKLKRFETGVTISAAISNL